MVSLLSFRRLLTCSGLLDLPERKSTLPPTCVSPTLCLCFQPAPSTVSRLTAAPLAQQPPHLQVSLLSGTPSSQMHADNGRDKSYQGSPQRLPCASTVLSVSRILKQSQEVDIMIVPFPR